MKIANGTLALPYVRTLQFFFQFLRYLLINYNLEKTTVFVFKTLFAFCIEWWLVIILVSTVHMIYFNSITI